MTRSGASGSVLKNGQGEPISPRAIFHINFPARLKDVFPPKPPHIGPHVGVVLAVKGRRVAIIYAESNQGSGLSHPIDPGMTEAYPFGAWIKNRTHFRVDTTALVDVSLIGDYIGTCLAKPTFTALQDIADAGMRSNLAFDISNYVAPQASVRASTSTGTRTGDSE